MKARNSCYYLLAIKSAARIMAKRKSKENNNSGDRIYVIHQIFDFETVYIKQCNIPSLYTVSPPGGLLLYTRMRTLSQLGSFNNHLLIKMDQN